MGFEISFEKKKKISKIINDGHCAVTILFNLRFLIFFSTYECIYFQLKCHKSAIVAEL